ncbi:phage baseplate protein [Paenibacillus taiwanensis]|uniref:phage baseplate protein n=1 Tax=Paenibacillus taiwanensis TaxID=401638 RepID=UPI0006854E42|nr:hypothetical protein [Paenibacillus taiwanensis]
MIQFWLSFQNGAEHLRLPVPPQTFEMQTGTTLTSVNIHSLGEANVIGRRRLKAISLSSYFPIVNDGLCQYSSFPTPQRCIRMIEKWRDSGKPIRLIIQGQGLNINEAMAIENFNYSQKHGPEDVQFTLDLKEYRFLTTGSAVSAPKGQVKQQGQPRPNEKQIPLKYRVMPGDTWFWIARKIWGSGAKAKFLQELNEHKGIGKKTNTMVLDDVWLTTHEWREIYLK